VIGFLWGNKGLFDKKHILITPDILRPYLNQSGFYLLGRNSDKIRTLEEREKARLVCEELALDGLVIVGASHTLTDVAQLANYFIAMNSQTKVIGIPASIDNNIAHQKL
jgi:6-phosphofructokinase